MPKWCPNWHGEFVDGVEKCPDCGAELQTEEPEAEPAVDSASDDFALVRSGLRIEELTPLVRRAAIVLFGVAAVAAIGWLHSTWYILDRTGGDSGPFGFEDDGTDFSEYLYLVVAGMGPLVLAGLLFAAATALWVMSRWLEFKLRRELYLDGE